MDEPELPKDAPRPRLCHLIKRSDFVGYGFNLHAERNKIGQYVGKVDEGSPASLCGMKEHDRIVEVNGVNIGNENHKQVVERIKTNPNEAQLLLVDRNTDSYYKERKLVIKGTMPNVLYLKTPTLEEDDRFNESLAKRVTIAEPERLKDDDDDDEDYDPNYATIATPSPPPPPEVSTPPPEVSSPPPEVSSPPPEVSSPVVQEVAPSLVLSHVSENEGIEDLPLPPAPVIENENPSLPPPPHPLPAPTSEATPAPPTPPPQTADVIDGALKHDQQLEIEIPSQSAGSPNDSVTPPPPYESIRGSTTVETPEASPLPSPNGKSPAAARASSSSAKPASSSSVAKGYNNNNNASVANGNGASNSNTGNTGASGEPVFGLSVADMRARLQAKKRVDVREAEVNRNFKEKYEIFQKL